MRHTTCWKFRPFPRRLYTTSTLQHALTTEGIAHLVQQTRPPPAVRKLSDPLRILFCGSDDFSCRSLHALCLEHRHGNPSLVERLEVMVRPGKRKGRNRQLVHEAPCKVEAEKLGLTVHERDTFTGWNLPEGTNLVICVSFGLFVPPRILKSATFGGLNVHPSLLPHLRGPAPVHHAILRGDRHIGVSLQTLDSTAFDNGVILAQTPSPGVDVAANLPLRTLLSRLGDLGAGMLVQGLRDGVHVPPLQTAATASAPSAGSRPAQQLGLLVHAPKLTREDSRIDWSGWQTADWQRRSEVFGALWTHLQSPKGIRRVIMSGIQVLESDEASISEHIDAKSKKALKAITFGATAGQGEDITLESYTTRDKSGDLLLRLAGVGTWLRVKSAKVEGRDEQRAALALQAFRK